MFSDPTACSDVFAMSGRRSLSKSPASHPSDLTRNQIRVLENFFQSNQFVSHKEAEKLSKDLRMPVKKIKAWFINMRRKSKRQQLKDTLSEDLGVTLQEQYPGIKQPSVPVLMDMNSITALKNSLESSEIVIGDEEEDDVIEITEDDSYKETDISEEDTSTLLEINMTLKDVMENNQSLDDGASLMKENEYIEALLQKIEHLENIIKEKEGKVFSAEKKLKEVQMELQSNEKVLSTVQESIPKVVSDHKKALLDKDAEILKWKIQAEETLKSSKDKTEHQTDRKEEAEKKYEIHITQLKNELKNKDNELKIMRYKVTQAERNEYLRIESEEKYKKSNLELLNLKKSTESQNQKLADLELDVFSKSVEIKSMAQTIATLNEKLKTLQELIGENPKSSEEIGSISSNDPNVCGEISFNQSVVNGLFTDILNEI